jgi:hypothetical protein
MGGDGDVELKKFLYDEGPLYIQKWYISGYKVPILRYGKL